jgi:myo-inositol-1-phosphate synthase
MLPFLKLNMISPTVTSSPESVVFNPSRRKVRVAIIGVGNCASSLVQGVHFYRDALDGDFVPGLMNVNLGGYHVGDIEFSAAFDIDINKVGKDLADAILAEPNNTIQFATVPAAGVLVNRGITLDGLGKYVSQKVVEATCRLPMSSRFSRIRAPTWWFLTCQWAQSRPRSGM